MWSRGAAPAALLSLAVGIVGCAVPEESLPPAEPGLTEIPALVLRGEMVWGHETRSFTECGASEAAWVIDQTGGELGRIHSELASGPYQAVFFEVEGHASPAPETGFGAGQTRALTVTGVRRAEAEGFGCDEDLAEHEFRAFGTEPFWSLTARSSGLTLRRSGLPPAEWPPAEALIAGGSRIVRSIDGAGRAVDALIEESRCVDAMAGSYFAFSVEVRIDGELLRGCAVMGDRAAG